MRSLLSLFCIFGLETPSRAGPSIEPAEAPAVANTYALEPAKSLLYVVVANDPKRLTPVTGHNHAITATSFTGSVTWDVDDAEACAVHVRVPIASLAVDPGTMRATAGLPDAGAITDSQKQTVIRNMQSKRNLGAPPNTDLTFEGRRCDGTVGTVHVTGDMQIAGVTREITVTLDVTAGADTFRARGRYSFLHEDYGMTPFTYGPFAPRNRADLEMVIDLEGSRTL